jgi:hypothetical protein
LLCQALHTDTGALFYLSSAGLAQRATLGRVDAGLERFAQGYWRQRQLQAAMTTVFTAPDASAAGLAVGWWTSPSGAPYGLIPLSPGGEAECVGLLACAVAKREVPPEVWALAAAISLRLQALGDLPESKEPAALR